jgi:hypothetical protein
LHQGLGCGWNTGYQIFEPLPGIDQDKDWIIRRALFYTGHPINSAGIKGIRTQPVKTACGKGHYPTLPNHISRLLYNFRLGLVGIYFLYA